MKNIEFPNIKENATVGDLYDVAITIAKEGDKDKAQRYFNALVEHCVATTKEGIEFEEAKKITHSNIGYWAGYHEKGTIEKVHEVFGSAHPVFGKETPNASDAFNLGMELGQTIKKNRELGIPMTGGDLENTVREIKNRKGQ